MKIFPFRVFGYEVTEGVGGAGIEATVIAAMTLFGD